ncbi:unnamed protein product, partial [Didymodactylos carnosus]
FGITNTLKKFYENRLAEFIDKESKCVSTLNFKDTFFKCYNNNNAQFLKEFYQLDCDNLFLKNISLGIIKTSKNNDVCELFNDSLDDNVNHTLYSRIKHEFSFFQKKIDLNDIANMSWACPGCHYIQIIDSELYIVPRNAVGRFRNRPRSTKTMLQQVVDIFKSSIGDLEMFIQVQDAVQLRSRDLEKMRHNVPVFGYSKTHKEGPVGFWGMNPNGIILIPCFTFWIHEGPGLGRWRSLLETLPKVADKIKWENRIPKLLFRGARTGDRYWLTGIGERRNDSLLDIEFMEWKSGNRSRYYSDNSKTLEQFCEYKYLLHQEGWSYSNRLKYLMVCGAPVIYANFFEWEEHWYQLLKHDYNVLIFKDKYNETLFKNLTRSIVQDDKKAKLIGQRSRELVQKYLSEQAIFCYLRNVLIEYSNLFSYKPVKHPTAVKIDDYILSTDD